MFQEIITRAEAIERGLKHYFTGKPCKHGHVAERVVACRHCVECDSERKSKWRQENKDYYAKRYHENADKIRAVKAKWALENKDKVLAIKAKYRQRNRSKLRADNAKYERKNPDKRRAYSKKWQKENPEKSRAIGVKRRAAKRQRLPSWFDELDHYVMVEAVDLAKRREAITGHEWHVDHMITLRAKKASGLHCASNLQVIPATLNLKKHNKMIFTEPGEWIKAL